MPIQLDQTLHEVQRFKKENTNTYFVRGKEWQIYKRLLWKGLQKKGSEWGEVLGQERRKGFSEEVIKSFKRHAVTGIAYFPQNKGVKLASCLGLDVDCASWVGSMGQGTAEAEVVGQITAVQAAACHSGGKGSLSQEVQTPWLILWTRTLSGGTVTVQCSASN